MRRKPKLFRIISISIIAIFLSEMPIMANPDILNKSLLASRQALLAPQTNLGSSPEPAAEISSSDQEGSTQQEAPQQRKGGLLRRIALEGAILFGIGLSIAAFYTFSTPHFSVEKILLGGLLIFAGIVIEAAVFSSWLASKLIKIPENRPVNFLRRRWAFPLILVAAISIGSVFYAHHAIVSRVNYFSFDRSLYLGVSSDSFKGVHFQEIVRRIELLLEGPSSGKEGYQVSEELLNLLANYYHYVFKIEISNLPEEVLKEGVKAIGTSELFRFLKEGCARYPNSLSIKVNVLKAKELILAILETLFETIRFEEDSIATLQPIVQLFGELMETQEDVSEQIFSENTLLNRESLKIAIEVLNYRIHIGAGNILWRMASSNPHFPEELKQAAAHERKSRLTPSKKWSERVWAEREKSVSNILDFLNQYDEQRLLKEKLEEIQNLKIANVNQIELNEIELIKEIHKMPKEWQSFCLESARAYRIPTEVLIANMIRQSFKANERITEIREGLELLGFRGALPKSITDFLYSHFPISMLEKRRIGIRQKWKDFLGGVIFNGKTSLGPFQIRPVNVKRYQGWERFGVDANGLSNQAIAWRLLAPKYSIEARAKMFRIAIEEVKAFQNAAQRGILPDLSQFNKEARGDRRIGMQNTLRYYLSIPSIREEGYDWILGQYHPMYGWDLEANLTHQKLIIKSGVLDNKPAEFVGITTAEEIEQLMDIYKEEDAFFKDAVVRTLERLILHADPEIREKASRSLKSLPRPTSQRGEIQKQQGDSLKSQLDKAPEAYEPDWIRSKKFKKFLSWVQKIPNGQISSDNIINNFLFLEMKMSSREEVERTYKFLSESIHQVKQKIHYSLSPEEQLKRVHEILTLDLKIQIKSDRNKILLSDSLPNKILDCATASLVYLAIADELNLPLFVARAPNHVFIRYADEERQFNFETTSGELKTNDDYKNWLGIHELSVNNGVFLKSLSQKELYGLVYFNIGNVEASRGHYKEAVKYYLQALRLNPKDAEACSNLGNVKNKLKEYKEYLSAIKYSTKATKLDPLDVQSYYNRGASKYKLGIYLGAIKDFTWAIKLNPNYAKAYFSRGLAYEALGQFDKAIKDQKKALELDPSLVIHLLSVIGEIKGEPSLNSTL